MTSGECNCGAIRFEINSPLSGVYVCHCSLCRRHTGTNGNAVLLVAKDALRWLSGAADIVTWKKPDHDWRIGFCKTCGSQVPGENDSDTLFVPAGLLNEDPTDLEVVHHIYVDSKASWDVIGDNGKQHSDEFKP